MNSIAGFRLCKLNGEDLIKRIDEHTDNIYKLRRIPDRHIPARPDEDFDLLIGELMVRFKETKDWVVFPYETLREEGVLNNTKHALQEG